MDDFSVPTPTDIAKVTEAATGFAGAIDTLFPGIAMRSAARAESRKIKRMQDDIERTKKWGESIGLSSETIQIMCSDIYSKSIKRERFENVIEFANERIDVDAELFLPDQAWAESFQEKAEKACDSDVQKLWGAILAGELESSGSFSKRTMGILESMSKAEAETFRKVCSYTTATMSKDFIIHTGTNSIMLLEDSDSYYNHGALSVHEVSTLQTIGLLATGLVRTFKFKPHHHTTFFTANGNVRVENVDSEKEIEIPVYNCIYESAGKELSTICPLGTAANLKDIIHEIFSKKGLQVSFL